MPAIGGYKEILSILRASCKTQDIIRAHGQAEQKILKHNHENTKD
jgi:hypothetical protein